MSTRSADDLVSSARRRIHRVEPPELERVRSGGALVVDIRPERQRALEGELGFGVVVERNVLEWRFDLQGSHALPEVEGYDQPVVVVCSEGYASSLAAASLRELGFSRAGDLAGGYRAWRGLAGRGGPAGATGPDAPGHNAQLIPGNSPAQPHPAHRVRHSAPSESGSCGAAEPARWQLAPAGDERQRLGRPRHRRARAAGPLQVVGPQFHAVEVDAEEVGPARAGDDPEEPADAVVGHPSFQRHRLHDVETVDDAVRRTRPPCLRPAAPTRATRRSAGRRGGRRRGARRPAPPPCRRGG